MKYLDFEEYPRAWLTLMCVVMVVLFSGCATAPAGAPVAAPDAPLTAHDVTAARALALQKIGESATDGETKRLAIFAVMSLGQGSAAPAAPVVVQTGGRTVGDAVFGFLDRTLERGLALAPAYLAYKGQARAAETSERIAGINRDVAVNQANNFLQLGVAGIGGTRDVGLGAIGALGTAVASVASQPRTSIAVSGNSGPVNIGSGSQTNSSNNPVNPAPVVCGSTTTAGVACSRGP